jgi:hypothetical protein
MIGRRLGRGTFPYGREFVSFVVPGSSRSKEIVAALDELDETSGAGVYHARGLQLRETLRR